MTTDTCAFSSCSSTRTPPCRNNDPHWNEPNTALCHHQRPPPVRRPRAPSKQTRAHHGHHIRPTRLVQSLMLSVLFSLLFLCQAANADSFHRVSEPLPKELLFDPNPPPPLPRMHLAPRQADPSSILPSTTIRPGDVSETATATGSSIQTATETTATLPRPFDTNLGNNFTTSTCPTFFHDFLNNQAFSGCLPFSLLLQTSNGFFTASRSPVRLTQTLEVTCNVNYTACSALMAGLAQEIQQDTTCGQDLAMRNPMVQQAYNGFVAYDVLYHAGCLTDSSGSYCYANAATNQSAPSSSYIYYLPLGVQLPGGSRPACNNCLQNTMAVFAQTASNTSQPLSTDYVTAAEQVQMNCGPTFAETSVEMTSAASLGISSPTVGVLALAALFSTLAMTFFV